MPPTIIAVTNQKGGVGKTTTTVSLGVGLAKADKKVLLVDCDPQSNLGVCLNVDPYHADTLPVSLPDLMERVMADQPIAPDEGILHLPEGVDLIPSNISLAGTEVALVNAMSRQSTLKQILNTYRKRYDYILLDCMPSLGMLTINALAAADKAIIPVQANYLSAKGLEQLLQTIAKVRRQINPRLKIEGILMTMVDSRTNNAKDITALIRDTYGEKIKVFQSEIPRSVRAAESTSAGMSIFEYDPGGKVAQAYQSLAKEVLQLETQRQKAKPDLLR